MTNDFQSTEHIWELFSAKLKSFFVQRVSDHQVAEDLLQEAFLRIHKNLKDVNDEQRLRAWVFQIARNLVIDHYRFKSRDSFVAMPEDLEASTDEGHNLNELVEGWLPTMIAQLPSDYREAVEQYELKGMPQQHIAANLGLSLSGAKSRVQRGREKLKGLLFDCCSFEKDRRGNIIGCEPNNPEGCEACEEACD